MRCVFCLGQETGVPSQLSVLENLVRRTIVLLTFHKYSSLGRAQLLLYFLFMQKGPMRMHTPDNQRIPWTPTQSSSLCQWGFRYPCVVNTAPEICTPLEARDFHLISRWTDEGLQDECCEDFKLNAPSTFTQCAHLPYCYTDSTALCQNIL